LVFADAVRGRGASSESENSVSSVSSFITEREKEEDLIKAEMVQLQERSE
jgi:hypothetical protein